jgi:hypothetical protein
LIPRPGEPPPWLVALDPAKKRCGVAIFRRGQLVAARTLKSPRAIALPQVILDWVWLQAKDIPAPSAIRWVTEYPVVYQQARINEPNLRGLVELIERIEGLIGHTMTHIEPPSVWKGGLSKRATKHRVPKRLEPAELDAIYDDSGDTYDAIGVGLWYVCRVNRGLVPAARASK